MPAAQGRSLWWRVFLVLIVWLKAGRVLAQGGGAVNTHSSPMLLILCLAILVGFFVIWRMTSRNRINRNQRTNVSGATAPAAPPVTPPAGKPVEAKSIFISYRRQDSVHITGRIYDVLAAQFGKSAVFKDVDSMPLGFDFREHLQQQVGRCSVLIAVIGKNWLGRSASNEQRLSDQRDHLRIEIETALERRIPVIPVLVDGVEMPSEADLPPSLARLAYHHGISVRPDPDFHNDADRLVRGIEPLMK